MDILRIVLSLVQFVFHFNITIKLNPVELHTCFSHTNRYTDARESKGDAYQNTNIHTHSYTQPWQSAKVLDCDK